MCVRLRPDLAERTVKDLAGQERPIKLGWKLWVSLFLCPFLSNEWFCYSLCMPGQDYLGRDVHRSRDVWVIRVETDFWDAERS